MDILDYVNPVRKDSLADGDRMIVTNGRDIFAVPPTGGGSPDFPEVTDALGGIISTDKKANTGKLSVEDLIVALVGIDQALKGAETGEFENKYSEKFDIQSVREKLKIKDYLPSDISLNSFSIFEAEQDSELEADFFFYPESTELVAEQWSGVVIVSEGATPLPNVVVEIGKDSNTLHIICTQVGSSKQSLLPGTYTIVLRREPVGLYTELEVEGSIEIE